ncbi:MAG TPA: sugar transferase [Methylomirabilota bacterium]|jgi:exopolysaccharide biosynthesis polyprenyl glycosylphosphotransferase
MPVALAVLESAFMFATLSRLLVRPPAEALVLTAACATAFYYCDLYDFRISRTLRDCAPRFLRALGLVLLAVAVVDIVMGIETRDGTALVTGLLVAVALLLVGRACCYGILRRGPYTQRVLIVGGGRLAGALAHEIAVRPHLRWAVSLVTETPPVPGRAPVRYPVLGTLAELGSVVRQRRLQRIVVALGERERADAMPVLLEARGRGIRVEDAVDVYERITGKLAIEVLPAANLVFGKGFRVARGHAAIGRAMSLVAAAVGLVIVAPLMAVIALAVKLDSRGPVFFRQDRVGYHGKRFSLIKFRTMRPVPAEVSAWVRDNADRITRVGRLLRKFRLDELPQFLNVLRGDMNLVGPRPHPVVNYELFTREIPYYALRAAVRPGVTGWAQVRYGYANDLVEETEKMRYDLYYVKHLSFWLDLRILIDTVGVVVSGLGSVAADVQPDMDETLPRGGESRAATTRDAA